MEEAAERVLDRLLRHLDQQDDHDDRRDHRRAQEAEDSHAVEDDRPLARLDAEAWDVRYAIFRRIHKDVALLDALAGDLARAASDSVRGSFASDEKAQKQLLDNAIATLQGKAPGADPVQSAFQAFFKGYAAEKTKGLKGETTLTDAQVQAVREEVEALMKKEGLDGKVDMPAFSNKVKLGDI